MIYAIKGALKKTIYVVFMSSTLIFVTGVLLTILFYQTFIPQRAIKNVAEKHLKEQFNETLKIGLITGDLFKNIVAENIECYQIDEEGNPVFFKIKKIHISYDLWTALSQENGAVKSIKKIALSDADIYIRRNKQGKFYFTSLKQKKTSQTDHFNAEIILKNSTIHFKDEKGLMKPKKYHQAFALTIKNINARIKKSLNENILLTANAKINQKPFEIHALTSNKNNFHFTLKDFDLTALDPYFLPFPSYDFFDGTYDVKGNIFVKTLDNKPFIGIDIYTDFKKLNLQLPFFSQQLSNSKGRVSFSNHRVYFQDLKKDFGYKKAKQYFKQLKKNKLIDSEGRLNNQFFAQNISLDKALNKWLIKPRLTLGLDGINSFLAGMPIKSNGMINILSPYIYLNNQTRDIPLENLKRLFPTIKELNYKGQGNFSFFAIGKLKNPSLFGTCEVKNGEFLQIACSNLDLAYSLSKNDLNFNIRKGNLLQTSVTGNGKISLNQSNIEIQLHNTLDLDATNTQFSNMVAGDIAMKTNIRGNGKTLLIESDLTPISNTQILNQQVDMVKLNSLFRPYSNLVKASLTATLNNNKDKVLIDIKPKEKHILSVSLLTPTSNQNIASDISSQVNIKGNWYKNLSMKNNYKGFIKIKNIRLKQFEVDQLELEGTWKQQLFDMKHLSLAKGESFIEVSGNISASKEGQFYIHDGSIVNIKDNLMFWEQFGLKEGLFETNGYIKIKEDKLHSNLEIRGNKIKSNFVNLDSVYGNITYENQQIKVPKLELNYKGNSYKADILLKNISHKKLRSSTFFDQLDYQIALSIQDGKLDTIFDSFDQARSSLKINNWLPSLTNNEKPQKHLQSFSLADPHQDSSNWLLFSQKKSHSLKFFSGLNKDKIQTNTHDFLNKNMNIQGYVDAKLTITKFKQGFPELNGEINIKKGQILNMSAKKFFLQFETKSDGTHIFAEVANGKIEDKSFKEIKLKSKFSKNNLLQITQSSFKTESFESQNPILGNIQVSNEGFEKSAFDLDISLHENDINLLSFVIPNIKYFQNDGFLSLKINKMKESSDFRILNGSIEFKKFMCVLENADDTIIEIDDYLLDLNRSEILLENFPLRYIKANHSVLFNVSGKSSLSIIRDNIEGFSFISDLDLNVAPFNKKYLSIKKYNGLLSINNLKLKGIVNLPISQKAKIAQRTRIKQNQEIGPVLSGEIILENGVIQSVVNDKQKLYPELFYDLSVTIGKSLFFEGSFLGEGVLSGLAIDLECKESLSPIQILGSINNPIIENKLFLEKGYLVILNTEFELLSHTEQQTYVGLTGANYTENYLTFTQVKQQNNIFLEPNLQLCGLAIIENNTNMDQSENESIAEQGPENFPYKHILLNIKGPIGNIDIFQFDSFLSSSSTKSSNELHYEQSFNVKDEQVDENQSALVGLLLPGVNFLENQSVNESDFLKEFGKQRINLLFRRSIRPVEQKLAKSIGVDYLNVDYNLSQALFSETENSIGLNLKKKLTSNKLYLNLKTRYLFEDSNQTEDRFSLTEAELNYFVLKNISLNLGAVKQNDIRDYQAKFSLRFSHAF